MVHTANNGSERLCDVNAIVSPQRFVRHHPVEFPFLLGPNDGGIQRGDGDESGDNEARPTPSGHFDGEQEREDFDGLEVMQPNDGRLGLTNLGNTPADDWAADSGHTAVPDAEE